LREISQAVDAAERAAGPARRQQLSALASRLDAEVRIASDPERVRATARAVRELAEVSR
jgi:hypothetical protein